ncbi:MAG: hypothetical protein IJ282_05030 [Lachnospiraceae bacterium]|nr:hypothetical protein [Lachnospiraceae bacterium]
MWEWNYAKEPFDMKLLVLRFLKKIWIPVIAALLGAAIIGGGYWLIRTVTAGPAEYELTSSYYVEYGTDPQTGYEYTYINHASWDTWIKTDYFVDNIWEEALNSGLQPEKYGIGKQDLPTFLAADLPSDLRMPISVVTTTDAELTEILAKAVEKAFVAFAGDQKEIDAIKVVDTSDVVPVDKDIRTFRACVLGAVLAVFFALICMLLYFIADDGIYLPWIFSCRYAVPALGAVAGYGEALHLLKGTAENVDYRFRDCKTVAVTAVEEDTDLKAVAALIENENTEGKEFVCIPSILQVPEAAEKLRQMDGVLLLVRAGVCNGTQITKVLHELAIGECKVDGVLLTDADEKLIENYERTGYRGKNR